jgi:hypothetical protein
MRGLSFSAAQGQFDADPGAADLLRRLPRRSPKDTQLSDRSVFPGANSEHQSDNSHPSCNDPADDVHRIDAGIPTAVATAVGHDRMHRMNRYRVWDRPGKWNAALSPCGRDERGPDEQCEQAAVNMGHDRTNAWLEETDD